MIFTHIRVYFGRFRHIQSPGTVRHIHVYLSIFRNHGLFRHIQNRLKSNSCIFWILIEQIQKFLALWLIWARNVSRIFRNIHKVTHTEAYFPTLGIRHIQDPAITGSSNVKQHLLFKSGFLTFFHCFKSKHSTFFLQNSISIKTTTIIITCHPR